MVGRKGWKELPIENGIGTVKLSSWKYFMDYIYKEMLDYEQYIWRGQRRLNWGLECSLDRLINQMKLSKKEENHFRTKHLERFKYATRGRRGNNPVRVVSENEWWAIGQHNGLKTPLLDWTHSPFVAAYFAFFEKNKNQTKYRVVYALHKPSVEKKSHGILIKEKEDYKRRSSLSKMIFGEPREQIEFIKPLSDENQRLVNQNGLFSRSPDNVTLEKWIETNFSSDQTYILMRILIPNKDRNECLKTLNRMNINHLTLFPDLYGASEYCNVFGEIKSY